MQIPGKKQLWESPRQYLGELPTTGKGVGIVVMDQGFDTTHPDLKDQIETCVARSAAEDVFDHDPVGHGTHVLGIVGGSGRSSEGRIQGVAPGARLIPVKMNLDPNGTWEDVSQQFANNIYWAVQHKDEFNIRIINCSFVLPLVRLEDPATGAASLVDPLSHAIKMATEAGIAIVAGVGNFGSAQITTPAGHPDVIAVGALDTAGTPDDPSDDRIASFSSAGRSISGEIKPDVVAPGVRIMSTNAAGCEFEQRNLANLMQARRALQAPMAEVEQLAREQIEAGRLPAEALRLPEPALRKMLLRCFDVKATEGKGQQDGHPLYQAQDGSSMASPIVAGLLANLLEVNPRLSPAELKEIVVSTARPLRGEDERQGHGAINAQAALAEAQRRI